MCAIQYTSPVKEVYELQYSIVTLTRTVLALGSVMFAKYYYSYVPEREDVDEYRPFE